jgi:splicing factor 3B subunit 2
MGLSTAERNKLKRERKKKAKEEERKRKDQQAPEGATTANPEPKLEVEIEYVSEPLLEINEKENRVEAGESAYEAAQDDDIAEMMRRFHARSTVISDDEGQKDYEIKENDKEASDDENDEAAVLSNRKLRLMSRPTVAELKNRVERADLVEAHDVSSRDPDFLLYLKAVPNTVPIPRHWLMKRKYLQGKRGIEKPPFQLPDFIVRTGISEVRKAIDEDENDMTAKKKNRGRVNPKMGSLDVDYRTLHDAFFKHQNKASIQEKLTDVGDLYYEGKEFELQKMNGVQVGGPLSERLRDALGMTAENSPPPWLINMQRFGPPPSYPNLKIPGLNAPLPEGCTYGYHLNGWGKPPVDNFGRPLYGGNPFDPPGSSGLKSTADWDFDSTSGAIITSDGKLIGRKPWGSLPVAGATDDDEEEESSTSEEESSDEESSGDEMVESDEEGEEKETVIKTLPDETAAGGIESILPSSAVNLRKQGGGDETPAAPKQLYSVLHQTAADKEKQAGAVFTSDVTYVVPGQVPEGARSVLAKTPLVEGKRKRDLEDDEDEDASKKFKF